MGYSGVTQNAGRATHLIKAIHALNGDIAWQREGGLGGLLSTAGGLVFTGDGADNFVAYRDRDGMPLWHAAQDGNVSNGPISVRLDGDQWIFVGAGGTLYAYRLRAPRPVRP